MTVEETAIAIIAEQCSFRVESITPESTLEGDLAADEIQLIEMVMELEEEFDITIPDEVSEGWKTVGNVIDWLKDRVPVGGDE